MSDALNRTTGRIAIASPSSPLELDCGRSLDASQVVYETYGRLDAAGSNAVLVCHALTGSSHVAGTAPNGVTGWWDDLVGPGKGIDTDRWFVICANVLGGCYGSTGPTSLDHASGRPYGDAFPTVTIRDMVRAQRRLLDALGITRLRAAIGGSMGGMQVLEWAALYPESIERIIPIAVSARQSPWCIGFNAIAREALELGRAAGDEAAGLRLARKVGMISYRSATELEERFGRARSHDDVEPVDGTFDVERYLERHGRKLVDRFDAATYRSLTRAMDLHDLAWGRGPLEDVLAAIRQPALCVGISTDVRYPVIEQRTLARLLPRGIYTEIDSVCGHDAFLIEHEQLAACVAPFLEAEISETTTGRSNPPIASTPLEIEA
jgi:homoserine O-acetyltransferase/O-succinyltransferase